MKVQPGDKLRIIVTTKDERLSDMFNIQTTGLTNNSTDVGNQLGYTVNPAGEIDFPQIGMQKVAGLTRDQIATLLKKTIENNDLAKDPVVIVDFLNMGVDVLGDVKTPGHYRITNDRFTILEALAMAGDLNITADRSNIKIVREIVGRQEVYEVNLLDAQQLYKSPAFYLQQNDVVYVEPNGKRKRESTINGNTALTYGFWMSLASFIMSTAVLITK
ncbi:MAG: polysaccharide biosynthesis/export family protein [Muribaculaceae bacterium]|nr:polysaccharide biosynthesis/export family protein [Muribaculaceae bacterium]